MYCTYALVSFGSKAGFFPRLKTRYSNSPPISRPAFFLKMICTQKSLVVKRGVALFKVASVKKAVIVQVNGKILITAIQVNLCCLIPESAQNSPKLFLLKFLPSTQLVPSQPFFATLFDFPAFFTLAILNRAAPFSTARLFLSTYHFIL